jgi:autotransporter-associated beta strand protein
VAGGTLGYGAEGALPAGGNYAVSGGNLDLSTRTLSAGTFSMTSGGVWNGRLNAASFAVQSGTVDAVLGGAGKLTKSGAGTVTLLGANDYTGGTEVSAGRLLLGAAGSLASSGSLAVSGGTFDLGGGSQTVATATLDSGVIENGTLSATALNLRSGSVNASLGGAGLLTKSTSGTVTLGAASTAYTGAVAINAGTLTLAQSEALGSANAVTVGTSGAAQLKLAAGSTLGSLNGGTAGLVGVDLGGNGLTLSGSGASTFSGVIAGAGSLTQNGTGLFTLNGSNTYSGGTTVNAGSLVVGAGGALATGSAVNVGASGAIEFQNTSPTLGILSNAGSALFRGAGTATLAGLSGEGTTGFHNGVTISGALNGGQVSVDGVASIGTLSAGSLTLRGNTSSIATLDGGSVTLTGTTLTVNTGTSAGPIDGSGALVKNGTGTLTLSGSNRFTGGTTVNAGSLVVAGGSLAANGAVTVNAATFGIGAVDGGTLVIGALTLGNGASNSVVSGGTLQASAFNLNSGSVSSILAGAGALTKNTAGTVTLSAANTFTGGSTINAGTLAVVAGGDLLGTVTNKAKLLFNIASGSSAFSGLITDSGAVEKTGAGTLVLKAASTYTGLTTVSAGVLQLGSNELGSVSTGSVGGNIALAASTKLVFDPASDLTYAGVISGANATATVEKTGAARLTLTGTNTYTGLTSITAGTLALTGNGSVAGSLSVASGASLALDYTGTRTFSQSVSGQGSVEKLGSGLLTFTGNNTYSGGTTVSAGTLVASSLSGAVVNNATLRLNANALSGLGAVTNNGTFELTTALTSGPGGAIANNGTFVLTLGGSGTFTNSVTGNGTTTMQASSGPVRLTLAAGQTWGGNITLNSNVTLTLLSGAKLGGNVTINGGTLDVSGAGGNVFAGSAVLTLTSGVLALGTTAQEVATANLSAGSVTGSTGAQLLYGVLNPDPLSGSVNVSSGVEIGVNTKTEQFTTFATDDSVRLLAGRLGDLASSGSGRVAVETAPERVGATLTFDKDVYASQSVLVKAGSGGLPELRILANVVTPLMEVQSGARATLSGSGAITADTLQVGGTVDLSGLSRAFQTIVLDQGALAGGTLSGGTLSVVSGGTVGSKLGSGFGTVTKSGTGLLALNAASEGYTEKVTIQGGTVRVGDDRALGTTGRVEFTTADAVLQVNGRNVALGELIGTGVVENGSVSSAGTLVFSSAGDANFGGVLVRGR